MSSKILRSRTRSFVNFLHETKELNGKKLCEWGLAKKELIITNYVNKEKEERE